MCIGRTVLLCF